MMGEIDGRRREDPQQTNNYSTSGKRGGRSTGGGKFERKCQVGDIQRAWQEEARPIPQGNTFLTRALAEKRTGIMPNLR